LLDVGRPEQLGADVLVEMLGLRVLWPRPVAEQQTLVQLLVDDMLIDRNRALGAPKRINDQVVFHFLDPDQVGDDVLDDAELFPGAYSPGQVYDAAAHRDLHIVRIECELFVEAIPNERAQLAVRKLVDLIDVLVILFHRSSESSLWSGSGYRKEQE